MIGRDDEVDAGAEMEGEMLVEDVGLVPDEQREHDQGWKNEFAHPHRPHLNRTIVAFATGQPHFAVRT